MLAPILKIVLAALALRAVNGRFLFFLVRSLAPAPRRKEGAPFVSVVVPARDEERAIEEATRSKCLLDDPAFEVVVVDDRSSDGTREILRRLEAEFPGTLRVVDGVEPARAAREAACAGRRRARREGDSAGGLARLLGRRRGLRAGSPRAGARPRGTGPPRLPLSPAADGSARVRGRLMVPTIPAAAFCYLPGWLMNVPSARAFGGGGGVFNLIRRDLFDRIGGHEALKASVVDDIQLGRNARKGGGRTAIAPRPRLDRLRMYHGFAEISKGLEKNGFFAVLASVPAAVFALLLFFFEGELAGAVLLGGALERAFRLAATTGGGVASSPAFFTSKEFSLAALGLLRRPSSCERL